jgi:CoA:oxalate CoA-transferase
MRGALAGMRVVDLINALAGASTTKLLGDLGADIIKVETPETGDFTRRLVPWVFETFNRDKRSVAINLRTPAGIALVKRLAASADVFVHSMRPGAADELGLGRDVLTAANPRLVYASLSAFGPTGPDSARKGVDAVVQAESGLAVLQGGVQPGLSFVDNAAGLAMSQAILAALLKRERTGEVDTVTISLLETALYLQSVPLAEFAVTGRTVDPASYARRFPTVGVYQASDGPFFIGAYWEPEWHAICEVIERPDLADDKRFASVAERQTNRGPLRDEMERSFATRGRDEWTARLQARGIVSGVVKSQDDLMTDEQIACLGSLEEVQLADGRLAGFVRAPYRFSDEQCSTKRRAPSLGSDTVAVLEQLGIDAAERQRLIEAGVIEAFAPDTHVP